MPEFVASDGVRLRYTCRGSGPVTVVYLHGLGGSGRNFDELIGALASSELRHVTLDSRGHGSSVNVPTPFSIERLANDVLELFDVLGGDSFVIVGHSFGGKVAMLLGSLVPQRLSGLVLLGAVGPGEVNLLREEVERILCRSHDLAFVRDVFRPWISVWPRPQVDDWLEQFSHTPAEVLRAVCELALWRDLSGRIQPIGIPALVVAGDADPVYGPDYQRSAVLPWLRDARMILANCGHSMMLEQPHEIATELDGFLSRLQPWSERVAR